MLHAALDGTLSGLAGAVLGSVLAISLLAAAALFGWDGFVAWFAVTEGGPGLPLFTTMGG